MFIHPIITGPRSAVSNMSVCRYVYDCKYVSDCRSRDASSILARSNTFAEIDHEIISTALLLLSADSRMVVFSYKRKYAQEELVFCLVKKNVVKPTDHPNMSP